MGIHEAVRVLLNVISVSAMEGSPLIILFADGKAAFDTVRSDALDKVLEKMGMGDTDRSLVQALMTDLKFKLNTKYGLSTRHCLNTGTPQGASEATLCYAWLIEPIIRLLTKMATDGDPGSTRLHGTGVHIGDVVLAILAFADDLCLLSTTVAGMQLQLDKLAQYYSWAKMRLNVSGSDKTAVMMFRVTETETALYWRQAEPGQPQTDLLIR